MDGVNLNMKRYLGAAVILLLFAAPALLAQDDSDHIEIGAFAEYFRMTDVSPAENFFGLGGRPRGIQCSAQRSDRSRDGLRFPARLCANIQQWRFH